MSHTHKQIASPTPFTMHSSCFPSYHSTSLSQQHLCFKLLCVNLISKQEAQQPTHVWLRTSSPASDGDSHNKDDMEERNDQCMCACSAGQSWTASPWAVASQAFLSMKLYMQEYWSGLLFPTPGDHPNSGIEPTSCISCIGRQILYHFATWEALVCYFQ